MKVAIITGGNGAVGQGIAQRLLEANTAITIILACRSIDRGSEAKTQILTKVHHSNTKLKDIHVMKLDLSSTTGVSRFCSEFKQSYDRLDYLYLNAGVLPIESTDLKTGLYNIITNPSYVAKTGGDILVQQRGQLTPQGYGSVFVSNTLGHYMLVKLLEPELMTAAPSLIVWVTSTTAIRQFYSNKDYQCIRGKHPYESSKRLCELISITMHDKLKSKGVHSLLMSPGNVLSSITVAAVHPVVLLVVLYLMRFLGCSGINITGYNAAFAAEWLSINEFQSLDSKTVYHSEISRLGTSWTREIQVDVCQDDLKETEAVLNKMDQIIKSQS